MNPYARTQMLNAALDSAPLNNRVFVLQQEIAELKRLLAEKDQLIELLKEHNGRSK